MLLRIRTVVRKKALVGVAVICTCLWFFLWHSSKKLFLECSDSQSMEYLDQLCSNYSTGLVTGSLCTPLCFTKEIKFTRCLGHGVKVHVLGAQWKEATIILKVKHAVSREVGLDHALRSLPNREDFDEATYTISKEKFIEHAHYTIDYNFPESRNKDLVTQTIQKIFSECDLGDDGVLLFQETVACWQLLEAHEYLIYMLLNGNSAIPEVLGTCGNLFAVQFAPSAPFLEFHVDWAEVRDWPFRARLALALLEMIESLEETEMGTLYLCDVQESNFGVVKRWDGSLVVKAIDMDISYFEHYLISTGAYEKNNSCTADEDCSLFACRINCDVNTHKCTGVLSSSNLQTICALLFKPKYPRHPALLANPPKSIALQLNQLLDECTQLDSPHIDWDLLKHLEALLLHTI